MRLIKWRQCEWCLQKIPQMRDSSEPTFYSYDEWIPYDGPEYHDIGEHKCGPLPARPCAHCGSPDGYVPMKLDPTTTEGFELPKGVLALCVPCVNENRINWCSTNGDELALDVSFSYSDV